MILGLFDTDWLFKMQLMHNGFMLADAPFINMD